MPTSKRKMNRKRWKQHVITGKRYNNQLGFNIYIDVIFFAVAAANCGQQRAAFSVVWPEARHALRLIYINQNS